MTDVAGSPPRASRRDLARTFGLTLAWIAGILLVAKAADRLPIPTPPNHEFARDWPPLARWDSGWYWQIATGGYTYDVRELQNNVAFFPLYPLMIRALSKGTGLPVFSAGILLSLVCLVFALLLLTDLVAGWRAPPNCAIVSTAAILCFPTAFFFASFYTESLFLLASVAAIWGAFRGRWTVAAIAAAACGLTRFNGFLILIPLAVYGWLEWKQRSGARKPLAALGAGVAGALAFPAYLWHRFHDPLFFFHDHARGGWPQRPSAPWKVLLDLPMLFRLRLTEPAPDGRLNFWVRIGALALFLGLSVALFLRRRLPEALWVSANVLLILGTGSLESLHRYLLVLFPAFVVLAEFLVKRPVLIFAYVFVGSCIETIFLIHHIKWIFVA